MAESAFKSRLNFREISIHDLLMKYKALSAELALCDSISLKDNSHINENVAKEKGRLRKQSELLCAAFQCSLSKPESVLAILELWWREEINAVVETDIHFSQRFIENICNYYEKEVTI